MWKTSHNVLKTIFQGLFYSVIYHCTQLKQIATTLSAYYDMNKLWAYVSALNLLWESQANNHCFVSLFDLLYHCYFPEILLCQNKNLFKSWFKSCFNALKQWKKLVGYRISIEFAFTLLRYHFIRESLRWYLKFCMTHPERCLIPIWHDLM